jgi:hypothetical protein
MNEAGRAAEPLGEGIIPSLIVDNYLSSSLRDLGASKKLLLKIFLSTGKKLARYSSI